MFNLPHKKFLKNLSEQVNSSAPISTSIILGEADMVKISLITKPREGAVCLDHDAKDVF